MKDKATRLNLVHPLNESNSARLFATGFGHKRGVHIFPHGIRNFKSGLWVPWSCGRDEKPMAAISHETALSLFELGDFNPAKINVTVPPTFRRNYRLPK